MYDTIDEFLNENCFYHVTCPDKKESILTNGLSSKTGIYCVRSNNEEVLKCIFENYVCHICPNNSHEFEALIIQIDPLNLNIRKSEVCIDHAEDSAVLKVQNIIKRKIIRIDEEDVYSIKWSGLANSDIIQSELNNHPEKLTLFYPDEKIWTYVYTNNNGIFNNKWI